MTVNQLQTRIDGAGDLPRVTVAAVANTSGAQWLSANGIKHQRFDNTEKALRAVALGQADAAVGDAPVMRYILSEREDEIIGAAQAGPRRKLCLTIAGSPLRETLDQAMLDILPTESWRMVLNRYLGQ